MSALLISTRVRPGNSLTSIAKKNGIEKWEYIYFLPENASFRREFPDPNKIDHVTHDGTKRSVYLLVPCTIKWDEIDITREVLPRTTQATTSTNQSQAPTETMRSVQLDEPGRLRHKASFRTAAEGEFGPRIKGEKPTVSEVGAGYIVTQIVEWDITIRGRFGITPEGSIAITDEKDPAQIKITTDGERLALDLAGKIQAEFASESVKVAVQTDAFSFNTTFESSGAPTLDLESNILGNISLGMGEVGVKKKAHTKLFFGGSEYDVEVASTLFTGVLAPAHLKLTLKIQPTAKLAVGIESATITIDTYVHVHLPQPQTQEVRTGRRKHRDHEVARYENLEPNRGWYLLEGLGKMALITATIAAMAANAPVIAATAVVLIVVSPAIFSTTAMPDT